MRKPQNPPFRPMAVNAAQSADMNEVRGSFESCAMYVERFVPEGRYRALAMTALEQASMWAIKGITHETSDA